MSIKKPYKNRFQRYGEHQAICLCLFDRSGALLSDRFGGIWQRRGDQRCERDDRLRARMDEGYDERRSQA